MDHPLWRGLAIQKSEVSSFWRLPLKNMGNILRSDLWAGSVALRLSDSQHLIFIHRLDTQNLKKIPFIRISHNYRIDILMS